MNNEKLAALMKNEAEAARLADCESLDEVYECLNKNGVDCTMEDAANIVRAWRNGAADNGSMSLDDLEGVAGGGLFSDIVMQSSPFKPDTSNDKKNSSDF